MLRGTVRLNRGCAGQLPVLGIALMLLSHAAIAYGARGAQPSTDTSQSLSTEAAKSVKRVLLLFGEDERFPMTNELAQSIRAGLNDKSANHIEYYTEYLDRALISDTAYEKELVDLWQRKYHDLQPDLIIVCIESALSLLSKHRAELFPATPIVFSVLLQADLSRTAVPTNATGVWSASPYRATLELALTLHPATKRVILVYGSTEFEKRLLEVTQNELREYAGQLEIVYKTDLEIEQLQEQLSNLPEHTVVLFGTFIRDKAGLVFAGSESLSRIASTTNAPIYGCWSTFVGSGMVGGSLINFELLGQNAAEAGARILAGERPQDNPPHGVPNVVTFDWRQLERWGLREKNLPPGSLLLFKQQSFFEQYRLEIVFATTLLILEALLIAGFMLNRARRLKAERENSRLASLAEEERRNLEEVVSNVPGIVWENRTDPNDPSRIVRFLSDYIERMLGYSVEEWQSNRDFWLSVVAEEDRERTEREKEAILASGKEGVTQFRMRAKNGRVLWAEAHLTPIHNDAGVVVGVRGVTLDITDQKRAEEALNENRTQLAGIIESAMDAIISIDENQCIALFNPTAERMFRCEAADALGLKIDQFIPGLIREQHNRSLSNSSRSNGGKSLTGPLGRLLGRRADGQEFPIEASVSEVELNGRKFYTAILRDITNRIRTEEALKDSEANYRSIFNAVNDAIFVHDIDSGEVVDVNRVMCEMYGVTADEAKMLGPAVFSSNDPPYTVDAAIAWIRRAAGGEPQVFEWWARDKHGRRFWVEVSLRRSAIGGKDRILAVVRDIAYRKEAEDALRESEARFRTMADTAPVKIWIADSNKLRTYYNQQWLNFRGRTLEQELGTAWLEGVHPDDFESCCDAYYTAFDRSEPYRMEYRLRRHDGLYRWVLDTGKPRFSPGGEFLGYIGSCIDITERKLAEQSLADLSGELIRARENECARIARELHDDLNQKIALVSVELDQLMQSLYEADEKVLKNLQVIINETRQISRDIHRMSYDLHPSKLVHLGLVAALKSLCEELGHSRGLNIEFTHDSVPKDLSQEVSLCFYRIAQECLNNVIRHSRASEARVELLGTPSEIQLVVSDLGVGFDVESPKTRKGLGLISMRERLRLVGGSIIIHSRASHGTQVNARVPLSHEELVRNGRRQDDKMWAAGG